MTDDIKKEELKKILKILTPEEKDSLRKKLNAEADKQKTMGQVGKDFNATRKKIQEIEKKALKKLSENLPDDVA